MQLSLEMSHAYAGTVPTIGLAFNKAECLVEIPSVSTAALSESSDKVLTSKDLLAKDLRGDYFPAKWLAMSVSALTASFLINLAPARANDGPDWLSDPNVLEKGTVSNDNVMIQKDSSALSLMMQADRALKSDKTDRALELIKRSLELNDDDLDAHMSYALTLERKMATQQIENPSLFNQCVKEWLAVLRNKYGEEKNETLGGIGIPGLDGKEFADEERQGPARHHLVKLTGSAPKLWETDAKYLARVERHGEATVIGKMIPENIYTKERKHSLTE